jgi:phospho-N-acetylmuramoyl-pentapeptide-transferase
MSLRLLAALFFALIAALALGPVLLPVLRRLKAGQTIRAEMHASHQAKAGTPTMGGLLFVIPAAAAALIFAPRTPEANARLLLALVLMLGHGLVGYLDDYIKVVLKRSLGLRARDKLLAQVLLAAILAWGTASYLGLGTTVTIPYLNLTYQIGPVFYFLLILLLVQGTANTVNFTDGVDGLLATVSIPVFLFWGLFVALPKGQVELAVLAMGLVGGCLGFLRFNWHPAKVFMGDVGSFALGGALAAIAALTKTELLVPIAGGLFVIEGLSVILQVLSFRLTGKRILRMSPLHHHFELVGWTELEIVRNFTLLTLLFQLLAWFAVPGLVVGR